MVTEKKKALHDYNCVMGTGCSYCFDRDEIIALESKTGMELYTEADMFEAIHQLLREG